MIAAAEREALKQMSDDFSMTAAQAELCIAVTTHLFGGPGRASEKLPVLASIMASAAEGTAKAADQGAMPAAFTPQTLRAVSNVLAWSSLIFLALAERGEN